MSKKQIKRKRPERKPDVFRIKGLVYGTKPCLPNPARSRICACRASSAQSRAGPRYLRGSNSAGFVGEHLAHGGGHRQTAVAVDVDLADGRSWLPRAAAPRECRRHPSRLAAVRVDDRHRTPAEPTNAIRAARWGIRGVSSRSRPECRSAVQAERGCPRRCGCTVRA